MKARLKGDKGSLSYLAEIFTVDPLVVNDADGFYLWSATIDDAVVDGRPIHWDVSASQMATINGIGCLINAGFRPVELTGQYDGYTGGAFQRISRIRGMAYTPNRNPTHAAAYFAQADDDVVAFILSIIGAPTLLAQLD